MKSIDLKKFRESNNLTQIEVGDYLGVRKAFISAVENRRSKLPKDKLTLLLQNPYGWDTSMLTRAEVSQSSTGDNTIQVTGNNVDMRNINQSLAQDEKKVAELEKRVAELTKDKEMLQAMIERLQAQMSKLLEMM